MNEVFTATEVIGHRGLGRGVVDGHPENTPGSFAAAAAAGVDWVEIDVRRTADDALVLYHNAALDDGRAIVDLTAAECAEAGLFGLEEGLVALPDDVGLDVDVKTVMEDAVDVPARRTVSLLLPYLRKEVRRRRVFVCSFDPGLLRAVQEEVPGVPTAWMPYVRNPADTAIPGALGTSCPIVAVDARALGVSGEGLRPGRRPLEYTVRTAHRAGLEIMSWCPSPTDAARYAAVGMDAVVVDDVPGTLAALRTGGSTGGEENSGTGGAKEDPGAEKHDDSDAGATIDDRE